MKKVPVKKSSPPAEKSLVKPRVSFRAKKAVELSPFRTKAIRIMKLIPKGRVASYGQVADLAGKPNGAREVAWLLHHLGDDFIPWQRVVGSSGKIMFPQRRQEFREQIRRLRREGVVVSQEGRIDLNKYRWQRKVRRKMDPAKPQMFSGS